MLTRGRLKCFLLRQNRKDIERKGIRLNSFFFFEHGDQRSETKGLWDPTQKKSLPKIEAKLYLLKLKTICKTVVHREISKEKDTTHVPSGFFAGTPCTLGNAIYVERSGVKDYFYADAKMYGLRNMWRVCPRRKNQDGDGRPVWAGHVIMLRMLRLNKFIVPCRHHKSKTSGIWNHLQIRTEDTRIRTRRQMTFAEQKMRYWLLRYILHRHRLQPYGTRSDYRRTEFERLCDTRKNRLCVRPKTWKSAGWPAHNHPRDSISIGKMRGANCTPAFFCNKALLV